MLNRNYPDIKTVHFNKVSFTLQYLLKELLLAHATHREGWDFKSMRDKGLFTNSFYNRLWGQRYNVRTVWLEVLCHALQVQLDFEMGGIVYTYTPPKGPMPNTKRCSELKAFYSNKPNHLVSTVKQLIVHTRCMRGITKAEHIRMIEMSSNTYHYEMSTAKYPELDTMGKYTIPFGDMIIHLRRIV